MSFCLVFPCDCITSTIDLILDVDHVSYSTVMETIFLKLDVWSFLCGWNALRSTATLLFISNFVPVGILVKVCILHHKVSVI